VIGSLRRMRWRLGAFALMALLVRALVPDGYMLAQAQTSAGRFLTLELCDAHGAKPQLLNLDTGEIVDAPPEEGSSSEPQPPCVELIAFVAMGAAHVAEIRDLIPGRGIAAPPPPPTGPPTFI
jgi:hypothetical protein